MLKLLKVGIAVACAAGIAYFAFFVPLGRLTLYQHLVGISHTDEARQLGGEIESAARDLGEGVASKVPEVIDGAKRRAADSEPLSAPLSTVSDEDRAALDALVREKSD